MAKKAKKAKKSKSKKKHLSAKHRAAISRGMKRHHRGGKKAAPKKSKAKKSKKAGKSRKVGKKGSSHKCCAKCGRCIFGGAKGMSTHMRKRHRGGKK